VTLRQQLPQGVTDQAGRGLVAGGQQFVHDLGHLVLTQRGQVAVVCQEEVAGKVVPRPLGAAGDQCLGVTPERRHPLRQPDLLVLTRPAPHEEQPTLRAGLDAGNVLVRDAEHAEDDERGQVPGQVANQVGPAARQALLEEPPGEFPDERFHGGDAPRREGDVREPPQPAVPWGAMFVSVGIGRKPPSSRRRLAAGQIGWSGARALTAENSLGV
jgi:hypothetical protein